MRPIVTVVSGTYNRLHILQSMVDSARKAVPVGFRIDFVIVDGGSSDGTQAWCKSQPDITLIEQHTLTGAIDAFTLGANAARGKHVLLANDDIVFAPESIYRAVIHLETNERCGAVAFADNRVMPPHFNDPTHYHVAWMPGMRGGKYEAVIYAQVGLFRNWLGRHCNWWRGHDKKFTARTYGGDCLLSANLWKLGYTVEPVQSCQVRDLVYDDDLRTLNTQTGAADSANYYEIFPDGVPIGVVPEMPIPLEDNFDLRILYLPVYEPGHIKQHEQKRGLRDALAQRAVVYELDYLAYSPKELSDLLLKPDGILATFQPHMLLMQCHGENPHITPKLLQSIKSCCPRVVIYNWNGDYWPSGLTSEGMYRLLETIDLQLCVNATVLPEYEKRGIAAGYWQIGYEEPIGDLPPAPAFDVVFLANARDDARLILGHKLKQWGSEQNYTVGLFGMGWGEISDGDSHYDFALGKAVMSRARLVIGDNQFPDAQAFVSNRIFQALAAGGAMLLHQPVNALEDFTGLKAGKHYVEWTDYADLQAKITYYLANEKQRRQIAKVGTNYCRANHSFEKRVEELFTGLIGMARRKPRVLTALQYVGRREKPFAQPGTMRQEGEKLVMQTYQVIPSQPLLVDPLDVDDLLKTGLYEIIETNESERLAR